MNAWSRVATWFVAFRRRFARRELGPIGAPVNPRVVMLDGSVVKIRLRRQGRVDGVDVFTNTVPLSGQPRRIVVDTIPARTEIRLTWVPEPVHLPNRIEADAHRLWLELMNSPKNIVVQTDTQEYADGVMTILEGLYPGAAERIRFEVIGRYPGTTG